MPSGIHRPGYQKEYRAKHADKIREYNKLYLREWRKRNRDKMHAYDAKWRKANSERAKESDLKKYRKFHHTHYPNRPELREKASIRAAKWQKSNPRRAKELATQVGHRRRARKYETSIGPVDFQKILLDSCGICGICNKPLIDNLHFDHIIPLARGGNHTEDNLQVSHPSCNFRKNSRLPEEL